MAEFDATAIGVVVLSVAVGVAASLYVPQLVFRSPMRERFGNPGPHCSNCGTKISNSQRIAIWARLRNNNVCVVCKQRLWPRWPVIETALAVAFGATAAVVGPSGVLPAFLVFAFAAVVLTTTDLQHQIIPNRVIYPCLFGSIALLGLAAVIGNDVDRLITALIGMVLMFLFFFVVWFVNPRGIGFGDVRLALLTGLFSGWVGLGNVTLALLGGLLLGAAAGLVLMALRRTGARDPIAYGPFLIAGAILSIFLGGPIATGIGW